MKARNSQSGVIDARISPIMKMDDVMWNYRTEEAKKQFKSSFACSLNKVTDARVRFVPKRMFIDNKI